MDITFIIPANSITGGNRVVFEYADRISSRGHDVTILYPAIPPYPMLMIAEQGVTTVAQKLLNGNSITFETSATVRRIPRLSRRFLENAIPAKGPIVTTSWRTAIAIGQLDISPNRLYQLVQHYEAWPLWNCKKCWKRASERATGDRAAADVMPEISPNGLITARNKQLVDQSLQYPIQKIVVSNWLMQVLETSFNQKVVDVIHNGINTNLFYPDKPTNVEDDRIHILAPYRDSAWKGTSELIEAFQKVRQQYDIRFSVFGPESRKVPDWINFHAGIDDSALRQLYSLADIFVFPSWVEGFGLPPIEAMACGTATISTDVGAVRDLSVPEQTVKLVEPRSSEALEKAILALIDQPEERKRLGKRGKDHVQSFTWDTAADKLLNALKKTR